jgi:hypothetical protein
VVVFERAKAAKLKLAVFFLELLIMRGSFCVGGNRNSQLSNLHAFYDSAVDLSRGHRLVSL